MVSVMTSRKKDYERKYPPSYITRAELRHQLSLSDSVINRMIDKGLLPKPYDFDGNERWRWSLVENAIVQNNKIDLNEDGYEYDGVMAGIDNVSTKISNVAPKRGNSS